MSLVASLADHLCRERLTNVGGWVGALIRATKVDTGRARRVTPRYAALVTVERRADLQMDILGSCRCMRAD